MSHCPLGVCAASTAALPVVKVVYIERCYQRHGSRDGPGDSVIQKKTAEENCGHPAKKAADANAAGTQRGGAAVL